MLDPRLLAHDKDDEPQAWLGMPTAQRFRGGGSLLVPVTWLVWNRSKPAECRVISRTPARRCWRVCRAAELRPCHAAQRRLAGLEGADGDRRHALLSSRVSAPTTRGTVMIAIVAGNPSRHGLYALFFAVLQTGAMGMERDGSAQRARPGVAGHRGACGGGQPSTRLFLAALRPASGAARHRVGDARAAQAAQLAQRARRTMPPRQEVGRMSLALELVRSSLLAATPVLLAGIGGAYTYFANVFNIAMEGMMLIGAFTAVAGSYAARSWVVGLAAGIGGGLVAAALFTLFAVALRTDEFVTGTAINMLALGGTTYALRQMFGVRGAFMSGQIQAFRGGTCRSGRCWAASLRGVCGPGPCSR